MDALAHQQAALKEITARAKAYFRGDWQGLGMACRWPTLVVGPSGSGKSTLAEIASAACGAVPRRLSTPGYMPAGAHNRGTRETIAIIAEHVAKHPRTFLVVDELDKLVGGVGAGSGMGSNGMVSDTWQSYIRGELLDLLDYRWPTGLNLSYLDDIDLSIEELTTKLKETVFILGIGTFQASYDASSQRTMGFVQNEAVESLSSAIVSNDTVVGLLGRELGNRFHSQLVRLPELQAQDYYRIAREAEMRLPESMRGPFRHEVGQRITDAIANKKSVRFLEEALTAALIKMNELGSVIQHDGP